MAKPARPRWRGASCLSEDVADLVGKLEVHAQKKNFLQYTTAGMKVAEGKLDIAALIAKKNILASLRELSMSEGMPCFTSSQVKAALVQLWETRRIFQDGTSRNPTSHRG